MRDRRILLSGLADHELGGHRRAEAEIIAAEPNGAATLAATRELGAALRAAAQDAVAGHGSLWPAIQARLAAPDQSALIAEREREAMHALAAHLGELAEGPGEAEVTVDEDVDAIRRIGDVLRAALRTDGSTDLWPAVESALSEQITRAAFDPADEAHCTRLAAVVDGEADDDEAEDWLLVDVDAARLKREQDAVGVALRAAVHEEIGGLSLWEGVSARIQAGASQAADADADAVELSDEDGALLSAWLDDELVGADAERAHQLAETPAGRRFLADARRTADLFRSAVQDTTAPSLWEGIEPSVSPAAANTEAAPAPAPAKVVSLAERRRSLAQPQGRAAPRRSGTTAPRSFWRRPSTYAATALAAVVTLMAVWPRGGPVNIPQINLAGPIELASKNGILIEALDAGASQVIVLTPTTSPSPPSSGSMPPPEKAEHVPGPHPARPRARLRPAGGPLRRAFRWLGPLLLAGLFLVPVAHADLPPAPQQQQTQPPPRSEVVVAYKVAVAHERDEIVHPSLAALRSTLIRLKMTGLALQGEGQVTLCEGCSQSAELPNNRTLTMTFVELRAGQAHVGVQLQEGQRSLLNTTVAVGLGGTFVIGGPPADGGRLLIPITAR